MLQYLPYIHTQLDASHVQHLPLNLTKLVCYTTTILFYNVCDYCVCAPRSTKQVIITVEAVDLGDLPGPVFPLNTRFGPATRLSGPGVREGLEAGVAAVLTVAQDKVARASPSGTALTARTPETQYR